MISEYIHFRYKNYLRYGLTKKSGPGGGAKEAYNLAKQSLRKYGGENVPNAERLQEIENIMNEFYRYHQNPKSVPMSDNIKQMNKEMAPWIRSFDASKIVLDPSTGRAYFKGSSPNATKSGSKKSIGEQKGFYIGTLMSRCQDLRKKIQILNIKNTNVLSQWKDILNILNKIGLDLDKTLKDESKRKFISFIKYPKLHGLAKSINALEQTLSSIGVDVGTEGAWAEVFSAAAINVVSQKYGEVISTEVLGSLKRAHTGSRGANIFIDDSKMANITMKLNPNYRASGKIGDIKYEAKQRTLNKVDVIGRAERMNPINLSVKNANMNNSIFNSKGLHMHSGSSVFTLLEYDQLFLGHYLNLVPLRKGGNSLFRDYGIGESARNGLHLYAKALILGKAITGDLIRIDDNGSYIPWANAFLINDNSRGKVRCVSVTSILKLLFNNIELASNIETGDFDNINTLYQTWVGSDKLGFDGTLANRRIASLIAKLHKMSLNVYMPSQLVQKFNS